MANITITIPDKDLDRVLTAFGYALGKGSPQKAELSDIKDYIITDLKQFIKSAENRKMEEQVKRTNTTVDLS